VPRFIWAKKIEEATQFAGEIGYPVIGKVVSPEVLHKADRGGVELGIPSETKLRETFSRFSQIEDFAGMLVEEVISGIELIIGAKADYQFGPVILLGIGGTYVELYKDITLRMAPLKHRDVESMIRGLKARHLLEGYRGSKPVNIDELTSMLLKFSDLVMDLEGLVESIDLNPVICSASRCTVVDARVILNKHLFSP
jgi:acyl-CoA synthetase (NDP forming)